MTVHQIPESLTWHFFYIRHLKPKLCLPKLIIR